MHEGKQRRQSQLSITKNSKHSTRVKVQMKNNERNRNKQTFKIQTCSNETSYMPIHSFFAIILLNNILLYNLVYRLKVFKSFVFTLFYFYHITGSSMATAEHYENRF